VNCCIYSLVEYLLYSVLKVECADLLFGGGAERLCDLAIFAGAEEGDKTSLCYEMFNQSDAMNFSLINRWMCHFHFIDE